LQNVLTTRFPRCSQFMWTATRKKWAEQMPYVIFAWNTFRHEATGFSPFF
jgi:hypothetical protein